MSDKTLNQLMLEYYTSRLEDAVLERAKLERKLKAAHETEAYWRGHKEEYEQRVGGERSGRTQEHMPE